MTAIEASCPDCQGLNIIEMKYREPTSELMNILSCMAGDIVIKHYTYLGEKKCSYCGKNIVVSVEVTGSPVWENSVFG